MFRRLAQQEHGLMVVALNALAVEIHRPEIVLRFTAAQVGGLAKPRHGAWKVTAVMGRLSLLEIINRAGPARVAGNTAVVVNRPQPAAG